MTPYGSNLQGEDPLVPVYPFNEPGKDITLYNGPLIDIDDGELHGRILMRCGSELDIRWQVLDDKPPTWWTIAMFDDSEVRLQVRQPYGVYPVAGLRLAHMTGSVQGQAIGSGDAPLRRVLVHWLNLPAIHSPIAIRQGGGAEWRVWIGRWRIRIGPWRLTLDRRYDHARVWDVLGSEKSFVMTHIMEVVRDDGQGFTASHIDPLIQSLHLGMSFAFGRWVAPALPVGMDATGTIAWQHWAPSFCDPGRKGALAWLHYPNSHDLHHLLSNVYEAFTDPDRQYTARLLLSMAIETNHAGRVEQRTMTAFSAIELLSWITLKLTGGMSKSKYDDLNADGRLRKLLQAANVGVEIDPARQPALAQFATTESASGALVDGPTAVSRVRNRLVHPKAPQDEVYHLKGLATDTWLLTRHYLNLLILRWLGYTGSYQTVLGPGGWAGDADPVPWSPAASKRD
jgi:hypothetical protein